jgi:hypothetical protein
MKYAAYILLLLALPATSSGDDCCDCRCDHCGCQAHCERVCHVVCEMKEVKVTCYCCKEEDICIPGHSKKCGEVCEPNPCCLAHPAECDACSAGQCNQNGCNAGCRPHSFLDCLFGNNCTETRTVWQPSCSGEMRSVNKLIKYEATKKVPTFKWVVEYRCDKCRCGMTDGQPGPATPPSATPFVPKQTAAEIPDAATLKKMPGQLPTAPANAKPVERHTAQADAPLNVSFDRLTK